MTKDERLGSDPFNFLNDTNSEQGKNEIDAAGKEKTAEKKALKKNKKKNQPKSKKIDIKVDEQGNNKVMLKLNGEMTIYSISEVNEILKTNINNYSEVELDLSHINKIDSAGFQLLLLSKNECSRMNKAIKIIEPSNEVTRIFSLYGETC